MKCVICKTGVTRAGASTVTLERGRSVVVVRSVPAERCANCGESYFDSEVVRELEVMMDGLERSGIEIAVKDYAAA